MCVLCECVVYICTKYIINVQMYTTHDVLVHVYMYVVSTHTYAHSLSTTPFISLSLSLSLSLSPSFLSQDEKARLEEAIARLSSGVDVEGGGEEDERMVAIRQHLQADREKLTKIRALLVKMREWRRD